MPMLARIEKDGIETSGLRVHKNSRHWDEHGQGHYRGDGPEYVAARERWSALVADIVPDVPEWWDGRRQMLYWQHNLACEMILEGGHTRNEIAAACESTYEQVRYVQDLLEKLDGRGRNRGHGH